MPKLKYQKYIVDTVNVPEAYEKMHGRRPGQDKSRVAWLDDSVIKGAFYLACRWYTEPMGDRNENHSHDFDEMLAFIGSDSENPDKLNGEIELWLEDEKYILTKSCVVFIPKGLKHLPLRVLRVDRPILHFGVSPEGKYTRK
jgi:quercetin dioxygenase-like cupin family protein